LHPIRSAKDRFEISPTLKLLFSPEEIIALTRLYEELAKIEGSQVKLRKKKLPESAEEQDDNDE
jgi:hypothetical protein